MAKGMSLSIGLNAVDPKHYGDWSGELNACEADAAEMSALAKSQGFRPTVLLTRRATRARVQAELGKAARQLAAGDIFMLSYSGHGGQLPDLNRDEPDAQDETWCLFDGELVDDELHALLGKFAAGVRVLVFSDSCHSGTAVRAAWYRGAGAARAGSGAPQVRYRAMPPEAALRTYRLNKAFYDRILAGTGRREVRKEPELRRPSRPKASRDRPSRSRRVPRARPRSRTSSKVISLSTTARMSYSLNIWGCMAFLHFQSS